MTKWVNAGAPLGNPSDMPPPRNFDESDTWTIGEPDLVLKSKEVTVRPDAPDWWGDVGLIPTGLTEDRYVSAVEVREVNDVPKAGPTKTVGGRFVFHHMSYGSIVPDDPTGIRTGLPTHEVGRNADVFPSDAGRLLAANSVLSLTAGHIHANGRDTKAHLEFAFKFFPRGYQPRFNRRSGFFLGNGIDIDVKPNQAEQELHAYITLTEHTKLITFEPHMHAPGVRMCLEAIWGHNIQTLNCVGYDHNWVKQYAYEDDAAPLLPKGTILHLIGFLDTTPSNKNPADPRNWAGAGRRSIANMFIDLGYSVALTEEQFQEEMARRRAKMKSRNDYDIGCPLCWAPAAGTAECTSREESDNDYTLRFVRCCWPPFPAARGRSDQVYVLERAERVAGIRGMDAERRWFLHHVLRLHEHELAGGIRCPDRSGEQDCSPEARTRVSRRTFIRAAIRFCSRFRCRKISAAKS